NYRTLTLDRKKYEAAKTLRLGPSPMLREHSRFVRNHSCFGMETTKYLTKLLGLILDQFSQVCENSCYINSGRIL
ncbi:hypothetical protein C7Y69_14070, partial [Alteromonas sp. KS69]